MSTRHILLNSWIWAVFEEDRDMTAKKLVEVFRKDATKSMASNLKLELGMLDDKLHKAYKGRVVAK